MKAKNLDSIARNENPTSKSAHQQPQHKERLKLGIWLLILLGCLGQARAATDKSGDIYGEIWTSNGSPYRLVGNIRVTGSASETGLRIEPGVEVISDGDWEVTVIGKMQVCGEQNAPVVFKAGTTNGWKGIVFPSAVPGSFFAHAIIEGAKNSGVRITNTAPTFTNCVIRDNTSVRDGGGVCAKISSQPLIMEGCLVTNNAAGPDSFTGGAIYVDGGCLLINCTIVGNKIRGVARDGGGVFAKNGLTMLNCLIANNLPGNSATSWGEGVYFVGGTLHMSNCIVSSNGRTGGDGAAVWVFLGDAKLVNCIVADNMHAGVRVESTAKVCLLNCTVVRNVLFGVIRAAGGTACVTNSILYYNNGGGAQTYSTDAIGYSCVQSSSPPTGDGNINFDPALCAENLSLAAGSTCIDAGHPDAAFNDECIDSALCSTNSRGTTRNDMGAYGGPGACDWIHRGPIIVTQPQSHVRCAGQSVTFTVEATGIEPLDFQWLFNGHPMQGRTSNSLTLTNLQSGDAGAYSVVVSDASGSTTSTAAQLVVRAWNQCVDILCAAAIRVTGDPGQTYVIKYAYDVQTPLDSWIPLATNTLSSNVWLYIDTDSPYLPKRFYIAEPQ